MEIKEKIKKLLDDHAMTWKDAADLLNCNYNQMHNRFRLGSIRFSEIEKIVDSLGYEIVFRKNQDK